MNNKLVAVINYVNSRGGLTIHNIRVAEMGDDKLIWSEFTNDDDTSLQTEK